jgi:DNA-binding PadR family transcriptional regulator
MKIDDKERIVLNMLRSRSMFGMAMVKRSHRLHRSSIYALLGKMEERGLIKSQEVAPLPGSKYPSRRRYRISKLGQQMVEGNPISEKELKDAAQFCRIVSVAAMIDASINDDR